MKVSKDEYIALRKKGQNYMNLPIHTENLQYKYDNEWKRIRDFLNHSPEEIQKWQLNRISYLVDYAFENIPLYNKKYSNVGYVKGSIKTWDDFYKLPYLHKEELIDGFPNKIVRNIEIFKKILYNINMFLVCISTKLYLIIKINIVF